ncbi:hypothetical protein [Paenibacillus sp. NAIST15-1]|uniref:hypothetical protein n=1 Tax=Paenibacillus sp. NAIST15-1 TaxID=1605994 RepID=UPI00086BCEE3|nr:hypothetical protein [Paenibacillus sp. NAIST15-1]GAV11401.1 hypothetical protein PBN151_1330 [Paenibacillus sp. NAIST15-1]
MKKFICEVVKKDRYEIEIDDQMLDEDWMERFNFCNRLEYDCLEEHAVRISKHMSKSYDSYIDGYGYPLINGHKHYAAFDYQVESGINIKILNDEDDIEVDVFEI